MPTAVTSNVPARAAQILNARITKSMPTVTHTFFQVAFSNLSAKSATLKPFTVQPQVAYRRSNNMLIRNLVAYFNIFTQQNEKT